MHGLIFEFDLLKISQQYGLNVYSDMYSSIRESLEDLGYVRIFNNFYVTTEENLDIVMDSIEEFLNRNHVLKGNLNRLNIFQIYNDIDLLEHITKDYLEEIASDSKNEVVPALAEPDIVEECNEDTKEMESDISHENSLIENESIVVDEAKEVIAEARSDEKQETEKIEEYQTKEEENQKLVDSKKEYL